MIESPPLPLVKRRCDAWATVYFLFLLSLLFSLPFSHFLFSFSAASVYEPAKEEKDSPPGQNGQCIRCIIAT